MIYGQFFLAENNLRYSTSAVLAQGRPSALNLNSRRPLRESTPGNWTAGGVATDIPYVERQPDTLQRLDIYGVKGARSAPVIIFVHGGGFSIGDKKNAAFSKASAFNAAGMVFVSLNYRLSPAVKYPTHVEDIAAAISWLRKNVSRYGGDPGRMVIMGHSAGAELAALVSTDERYLQACGSDLSALKGAILLDGGTYNLESAMGSGGKSQLEPVFGSNPKVWRDASVTNHVQAGKGIPPFLIIYVSFRKESKQQTEQLASLLHQAGIRADVRPAYNKTHKTLNKELGQRDDEPTQEIFRFLGTIPNFTRNL